MTTSKIEKPYYLEQKKIDLLYNQCMIISSLFNKHKIIYWIDGGMLLGSIRHISKFGYGGLIPWDDDLDFTFAPGEHLKLFSERMKKDLDKIGMYISTNPDLGFGIYYKDKRSFPPKVDIFVTEKEGDKIIYKLWKWNPREGNQLHMKEDEVFPIKWKEFGYPELGKLPHPNNPIPYFETCYGKSWKDWAIATHWHVHDSRNKVVRIPISEVLSPALPSIHN